MSAFSYRYIRLVRRLQAFDSPQLDALAERMGVLGRLNGRERYFLAGRKFPAFSFPGGIAFGRAYWGHLDDGQRMAIAAHEFAHTKWNDVARKQRRLFVPSLLVMVAFASILSYYLTPYASNPIIVVALTLASLVVFLCVYNFLSFLSAPWSRRMELRCDTEAARYIDGEDLISALEVWQGAVGERVKRTLRYRVRSRFYPTLEQRAEAIRAVVKEPLDA